MSQRIFYEIDGKVDGPTSYMQLQLMAASGILLPHHKVRLADQQQWMLARQVRGLFSAEEAAAAAIPVAAPSLTPLPTLPAVAGPASGEFPISPWAAPEADLAAGEGINSAFDFFSDAPAVTAPPAAAVPPAPPPPAPAKKPRAAAPAPPPPPPPLPPAPPEPTPDIMPLEPIGEAVAPEAPVQPAPEKPVAANDPPPDASHAAEIVGQAVEMIGADSARLLDGKCVMSLRRGWLQAVTRFTDGTQRTVCLNLRALDSATLEQRHATRRAKGGPYAVLSFTGGTTTIALAILGSDKAHRAFLEKVLVLAGPGKPR